MYECTVGSFVTRKKIHYGSKLGGQGIKDNYINNSINFAITRNFYISIWKGKKKKRCLYA